MPKETNISKDYVVEYRTQLGSIIQQRRLAAGLTPLQLANEVGVNEKTIHGIEAGYFAAKIDDMIRISIALGLKVELNTPDHA